MTFEAIATTNAPQAIGPYSQAIRAEGLLFVSGQVPLDPSTNTLRGTDVREQTHQVMENLSSILGAAGASFSDVASATIYLTDLNDAQIVNDVYSQAFAKTLPARATVQVAALPLGAKVEISLIAISRS